MLVPAENAS